MIIADTDVLIDYLRGTESVRRQVVAYRESEGLQTTAVTCFELLSGARGKLRHQTRELMATIPVLPLTRESASRAAGVCQELESKGRSIGTADSMIAGIALANDLPLLTRNRKHFEHIDGLALVPLE